MILQTGLWLFRVWVTESRLVKSQSESGHRTGSYALLSVTCFWNLECLKRKKTD